MKPTYGKRKWSAAKSAHWVWPSQAPAPSTRQDSKLISSCIFCCVTSLPGVMWCGMMNTRWHHNKNNSPKKHMFTINDYLIYNIVYVYIIIPELLPEHLPWNGFFQSSFFQEGCNRPRSIEFLEAGRDFQRTASIHTWIPPPAPSARNASPRRKQKPKKKGTTSQSEKNICWFLLLQFTLNMMHPVNIQQTSRQLVSLCSHSHVLVTPAPWKKRCEVLHHLARQVATFVQTQQPQDQRVE